MSEGRDALGHFAPGHTGGRGRPRGSRNKLGEAFIDALYADFQEHGASTIRVVREEHPAAYLKIVAMLMPRQIEWREASPLPEEPKLVS